jgi:hypothetical protein
LPLDRLGIAGPVNVRNLWAGAPLGEMRGDVAQTVVPHGAALLKVEAHT